MDKKYELIPSDIEGLFRVKALKDFGNVKRCDIGGYIQSENNLSHYGNCWIYDNAVVRDNAKVYGDAKVFGNAIIRDNAVVRGDARIFNYVIVCDNVVVIGKAIVCDNARIWGYVVIQGNAVVRGNAIICGDAIISSDKDYIVFKNWWSSGRYFTWTRSNNMWKVGCFYGTGEQLINKAFEDSVEKGFEYKKIVDYVESILENQRSNYE